MAVKKKADTKSKTYNHFTYIGPSLPGGKLKRNVVLCGSREEIKTYYQDVIEEYPPVKHLIVPVEKLGESREKVKQPGNILHKYYGDIINLVNQKKEV
ncbi:hypothetical protein [Vallitalea guaymasensis]|uniref:hypothetical protein n=1 Tax=Vallitalea guaymasensis TaxID=1185412 RepID=UPI000DE34521|nr:hypothetical protein [Vallitalea guaymasensis]